MFQVGDKVKCIDNSNAKSHLTIGKIYQVFRINNERLCLSDNEIWGWYPTRFEKVEEVKDNYIILEGNYAGKWWLKNPKIKHGDFIGNIGYYKGINSPIRVINNYEICLNDLTVKSCTEEEFLSAEKEFLSIKKPIAVKLNSSYDAVVYKDKIVVGCQEFTKEVSIELAKEILKVMV